jgi:RNA polymerase sigma factor (sigma-70 family)
MMNNGLSAAKLYTSYAPTILAYIRSHTPSREDAEDVLVEVFLAALGNEMLTRLDEKEQLVWLWRVTRNKLIDHYRRSTHHQSIALESVTETIYEDEIHSPESVTLRQEEYSHLQAHIQSLPALQQEVLRLRFTHGLCCAEIASKLGKREGAVRVMLSRTLNMLRTNYKQP